MCTASSPGRCVTFPVDLLDARGWADTAARLTDISPLGPSIWTLIDLVQRSELGFPLISGVHPRGYFGFCRQQILLVSIYFPFPYTSLSFAVRAVSADKQRFPVLWVLHLCSMSLDLVLQEEIKRPFPQDR